MKRLLALLLALVLMLSLAACKDKDDKGAEETFGEVSTGKNELEIGSTKNNTYKNEFAGITCTFDSEWTFLTDEQIRENNEKAMGMIGDNYVEALKNATVVTDMMATHANQMDTVNVGFEKLSALHADLSEKDYASAAKPTTKGAFESMGMTNVVITTSEGEFAGATHTIINLTAKYNGVSVYEKIALMKRGEYMVLVTACTWRTDGCQEILDQFEAIV